MVNRDSLKTWCVIRPLLTMVLVVILSTQGLAQLPGFGCVGDCDVDGAVTIAEVITLVSIALENAQPSACPHGVPSDEQVDVALIIQAVNNAVMGCPDPGADDCCQCVDFCAAPVNGTCGGCLVLFGVPCIGGSSCAVTPTPNPTPTRINTPIPTATAAAASDCCQCPTSCMAPIDGSCGSCTTIFHATCGGGMLCVPG